MGPKCRDDTIYSARAATPQSAAIGGDGRGRRDGSPTASAAIDAAIPPAQTVASVHIVGASGSRVVMPTAACAIREAADVAKNAPVSAAADMQAERQSSSVAWPPSSAHSSNASAISKTLDGAGRTGVGGRGTNALCLRRLGRETRNGWVSHGAALASAKQARAGPLSFGAAFERRTVALKPSERVPALPVHAQFALRMLC